eukprot:gnl/MRDRNA2_/MRDRNA2_40219_c0_seq2.p1 gnl/MRDRNA2_/MRDRNA2_40219_c0~~gnl/MRDRNA2_/MRDRNA2_40219_c0_seq2.p1  ORF type:complete len:215 (+),score=45.89 gnl/MRDRNA2_/MRDRNA2_40219_c0_seq2:119-763(+)
MPLQPGSKVQIIGTAMAGSIGEVVEFLSDKERWKIKFASGSTKNFKAESLEEFSDEKPPLPEGITKFWKIYVTNLHDKVTGAELVDYFGKVGTIAKEPQLDQDKSPIGFKDKWPFAVKIYRAKKDDRDRDRRRDERGSDDGTAALVEFEDHEAAHESLRLNNKEFKGKKIGVEVAGKDSANGAWHVSARSIRRQEAHQKDDNYRKEYRDRSRSR